MDIIFCAEIGEKIVNGAKGWPRMDTADEFPQTVLKIESTQMYWIVAPLHVVFGKYGIKPIIIVII